MGAMVALRALNAPSSAIHTRRSANARAKHRLNPPNTAKEKSTRGGCFFDQRSK